MKLLNRHARYKVSDIVIDNIFKSGQEDIVPLGNNSNGNVIQNNMPLNSDEAQKELDLIKLLLMYVIVTNLALHGH